MKPLDYEFEVGDEVITTYGEVGVITGVCTCDSCKQRSFYEPEWVEEDTGDIRYITVYDAVTGFNEFYKIGKYQFNNVFVKDKVLFDITHYEEVVRQRKRQLRVIEELEKETIE